MVYYHNSLPVESSVYSLVNSSLKPTIGSPVESFMSSFVESPRYSLAETVGGSRKASLKNFPD